MTPPEIDITDSVDRAARATYVKISSIRPDGTVDAELAAVSREQWDENKLPAMTTLFWRRVALAGIAEAVRGIARQAWDYGYLDDHSGDQADNPWAEKPDDVDWDAELKKL